MPMLNTFRVIVLATIGAIAFLYMREPSQMRAKRDLTSWFKYPYTCSNTQGRMIALTFDEGPADKTGAVLDALRWWNVPATFHFQTAYLANPDNVKMIQRAYNEGHLIGLRWDPHLPMPDEMPVDQFRDKLLSQANDLAYWLGVNKWPKYVRMPWNRTNADINQVLTDYGFVATSWNIDPQDYALTDTSDPKFVGEIIRTNATSHRSMIVLLHDIYPSIASWINNTLDIVVNIPHTTTANDTTLVRLDQCIGDAPYRLSNNPVSGSSSGSSSSSAGATATSTPSGSGTFSAGDKVSIGRVLWFALGVVALSFVALL